MIEGSVTDASETRLGKVCVNNIRYRIWHKIYISFKTCTKDMQVNLSPV